MAKRLVAHQRTLPSSQSVIAVAKTWFHVPSSPSVSVYRHRPSSLSGSVIQTEGAVFTHRNHAPCVHPPIDNYHYPSKYIYESKAQILRNNLPLLLSPE